MTSRSEGLTPFHSTQSVSPSLGHEPATTIWPKLSRVMNIWLSCPAQCNAICPILNTFLL